MTMVNRRDFITLAGCISLTALSGCSPVREKSPLNAEIANHASEINRFPIVLSSNENPFGPCPEAVEAASRAVLNSSHLYAREKRDQLTRDLAGFYDLDSKEILLGCGAIELLKIATDSFCSVRKPPIISSPVYEAIDYYAALRHIGPEKIPANTMDGGHDLFRMLEAAYTYQGLVYVCNPCNPTGTIIDKKTMTEFLDYVPDEVVVVVDEAYAEYVGPGFFSCMDFVRSGTPNLLVIRTFSKIYGLAGLRVGYCAGNEELIRFMAGHRLWNNINQAGLAAASAALKSQYWVEKVRRENDRIKRHFCTGLDEADIDYIPSSASFVLVSAGMTWEETHSFLRLRGGIVAGRRIPAMPGHVRISMGSMEDMDHLLSVLRDFKSAVGRNG
jgi:histidinol-phosphate aminotransferase